MNINQLVKNDYFFSSVRMTEECFRKINIYSQLISSVIGHSMEIAGMLTTDQSRNDGVATDTFLMKRQEVTGASGRFKRFSISEAYADVQKSKVKILGSWHSHGAHPVFHSPDDNSHLKDLLLRHSFNDKNLFRYNNPQDSSSNPIEIPYAISVVINNNSYLKPDPCTDMKKGLDYYCCTAVPGNQYSENYEAEFVGDLTLQLVRESNDIEIDSFELLKDLCSHVSYNEQSLTEYVLNTFEDIKNPCAENPEQSPKIIDPLKNKTSDTEDTFWNRCKETSSRIKETSSRILSWKIF